MTISAYIDIPEITGNNFDRPIVVHLDTVRANTNTGIGFIATFSDTLNNNKIPVQKYRIKLAASPRSSDRATAKAIDVSLVRLTSIANKQHNEFYVIKDKTNDIDFVPEIITRVGAQDILDTDRYIKNGAIIDATEITMNPEYGKLLIHINLDKKDGYKIFNEVIEDARTGTVISENDLQFEKQLLHSKNESDKKVAKAIEIARQRLTKTVDNSRALPINNLPTIDSLTLRETIDTRSQTFSR